MGNFSKYVQEGATGFLVEPGNEIQLAEALTRLLDNNDSKRQMGQTALGWIQNEMGWENIAARTLRAYETVVNLFSSIDS